MDLFEIFLWIFWILFLCYIGYAILKTIRGFPSNKTYDKKGQDLIPHQENCKACGKMIINPIVCEYCHQKFCEKHQHPFIHKCKESQDQVPLFENCFFDGKRTYHTNALIAKNSFVEIIVTHLITTAKKLKTITIVPISLELQ